MNPQREAGRRDDIAAPAHGRAAHAPEIPVSAEENPVAGARNGWRGLPALSDNAHGILLMCLAMALFTLNDAAMKVVLEEMPLYQSILLRGGLTTAALVALALWKRALRLRPGVRDGGLLALRSLAEVGATLAYLVALAHMPLANLSAIAQGTPLVVTLAAALVFREAIGWRRALAIVAGFGGVLIIIRPGPDGFDHWAFVGLLSVLLVVARDLATRAMSRNLPSLMVAVLAAASVTLVGATGAAFEGWAPMGAREGALIIFAGLALVGGYLTAVATMRIGDVAAVSPFRYTALLWALALGWLVFGQFPDALTLAGAALIVGSGVFTILRERRRGFTGSGRARSLVAPR